MADYSKIEKLPEVPQEIIDAVNNNRLVVFIGAGVSRIIGCMGWSQLARNLVDVCFRTKKAGKEETLINYKEKETLLQENDQKKLITIAYHLLKKNGFEEKFFEEFNKSLEKDPNLEAEYNIYNEIFALRGINVTTNADLHFDQYFLKPNIIFDFDNFSGDIYRTNLYKIHGTQDYRDSLVFTIPRYIKQYNKTNFIDFLQTVFSNYTVLFLGYGMSEFEILDFLITKYGNFNRDQNPKHFILLPFFSGEENILEFEKEYYADMGIQVIAYEKDENGYNQLYEVIKRWKQDININSTYTYDSFEELDHLLNDL